MKKRTGIVTLASGHSLILGSLNQNDKLGINNDLANFGLFNLAPDESIAEYASLAASLGDEEGQEFIRPIYRGLSETIVRRSFDPIDFSQPGVLKASMPLIVGQTVYTNHFAYVGNEVGSVENAMWENSYEVNGIRIPAGFNLQMKIDAKSHPKLARGILMDPPSVHSNSVTVNFAWEQSHPKMDYHEFRNKVGSIGADGKLIRRIATEINAYFETSFVSHGADPYAQKVGKDGKIVNPGLAQRRDSFSEELSPSSNFHFFSFKEKESFSVTDTTPLSEEPTIPNNDNNKQDNKNKVIMNKKLALALALLAGYTFADNDASLSDEQFEQDVDTKGLMEALEKADLAALAANAARTSELETQLSALTEEKTGLEGQVAQLTQDAAEIPAYKAQILNETLGFHTTVNNGTPDEAIKKTLEGADLKTLQAFHATFKGQMENAFPTCCQDCGSDNVARNSASGEEGEQGKQKNKTFSFNADKAKEAYRAKA